MSALASVGSGRDTASFLNEMTETRIDGETMNRSDGV